jgi:hypothetical protein
MKSKWRFTAHDTELQTYVLNSIKMQYIVVKLPYKAGWPLNEEKWVQVVGF